MKTQYVGLIFKCPLNDECGHCAFKNLRAMPVHKALQIWFEMAPEQQYEMLEKHHDCVRKSEIGLSIDKLLSV
ncbi:hypothetical protein [Carboxylicivirga sp. RSCT41]|uniref:hypothetical protein n=1 Tax=Carboxylicivirga agarovorans TaxID=3417570 RepID=UPI003D34C073